MGQVVILLDMFFIVHTILRENPKLNRRHILDLVLYAFLLIYFNNSPSPTGLFTLIQQFVHLDTKQLQKKKKKETNANGSVQQSESQALQ